MPGGNSPGSIGACLPVDFLSRTGACFEHLREQVALERLLLSNDALRVLALPESIRAAGQALHCSAGLPRQLKQP